jgi:hypothetical protein
MIDVVHVHFTQLHQKFGPVNVGLAFLNLHKQLLCCLGNRMEGW